MAERDPRVIVITAAMLEGTGLVKFQQRFPERCLDVGMAEQHGVGLAAGLALAGYRPICAIYSTFLQRAYDQVFQEVALQHAPVLFCLDRGGLVGSDGATHNGVFDIAYLRCLPNFVLMSPRDTGELAQMMDLAARARRTDRDPLPARQRRAARRAARRRRRSRSARPSASPTATDGASSPTVRRSTPRWRCAAASTPPPGTPWR